MRISGFIVLLGLLLSLPFLGKGQTITNNGAGGNTITWAHSNSIAPSVLNQVLTMAAPFFGYTGPDFIDLYQTCGCVSVEQVGPGVFRVTYGGLGIQIIIDGSRSSGPIVPTTMGNGKR